MVGFAVGEEERGDLNTTLKPESFGEFAAPITMLMLITPEVTITSTGKLHRFP